MSDQELVALAIKGGISELEEEDQKKVYALKDKILELVEADLKIGGFAIALVGVILQQKYA